MVDEGWSVWGVVMVEVGLVAILTQDLFASNSILKDYLVSGLSGDDAEGPRYLGVSGPPPCCLHNMLRTFFVNIINAQYW
jgi:hypothetical protein